VGHVEIQILMILAELEKVTPSALQGLEVMEEGFIGCSEDNVAQAGARIWITGWCCCPFQTSYLCVGCLVTCNRNLVKRGDNI
jgi:hypothetical protein